MKRFLEFFCAILLSSFLVLMSLATQASATVTFFTNEASFNAQVLSSTLIDFEGYSFGYHSTFVDRGVTFKSDVTVLEPLSVSGVTLASTILAKAVTPGTGSPNSMFIDLTTAGTGYTAFGGIFGEFAAQSVTSALTLYGPSGVLDSQTVVLGSMINGRPQTFFGWTSTGGDTITGINFYSNYHTSGLDNIQFGQSRAPVPEPATVLVQRELEFSDV